MTQELIANMPGMHREGVTEVALAMPKLGLTITAGSRRPGARRTGR
jgi:hypothetical protein